MKTYGLVAVSALLAAQGALAQQAPPAAGASEELAEVVVTAERRSESAQTTPMSMSVFTAEDIARRGIVDIRSLATNDTSLSMTQALGGAEPYLTLRGVSSSDTTEIGDPAVGVATDGFFKNRTYDLLGALYDVDRIEVLRGPQGTLYGRNTAGGVVNVITKKPTDEFEAEGAVELGTYNEVNYSGAVNLPLSEKVQVRVAFASQKHDGYRDVITEVGQVPEKGDDQDTSSARVEVAFEPVDHLKGLLTFQTMQIGGTGGVFKLIPFVNSPTVPGDIEHTLPIIGSTTTWANYTPTWQDIDEKTYKLELNYDGLPGGTQLVYLGGYDNLQWHHSEPVNTYLGYPFTTSESFLQNEYPKTQSHELRLVSSDKGAFTWQGGIYFFEERSTDLDSSGILNPGATNAETLFQFAFPVVEDTSRAAYGQANYKFTDELSLSAGVRYTKDDKERTGVLNIQAFDIYGVPETGSSSSSKTTFHLGLDYQPTPMSLEYAKVDTGYKAGGFTTCNPYGPEEVTTYEIGTKNRLLNNTTQLNVAGFFNDYKNQQIATFVPSSVCISNSTEQNAGGSHIYGLEADFRQLIDPIGTFNVDLTYLHARFTNFVAAPGLPAAVADCVPAANGNCQLAGNTLPNSPTWTIAAGLEHQWAIGADYGLNGRVEGKYVSQQYYDPFNYASTTSPGYAIVNGNLDLSRGNWRVGLWLRNALNKFYYSNMQEYYTISAYEYSFGAPRTAGVRFQYSIK